jgi:rubrerythrin
MPPISKKKCPVCGEEIPEDAEICPKCDANLELFELEEEMEDEDITPLESFLDSIGDEEDVDPEKLLEEMRNLIQVSVEGAETESTEEKSEDMKVEEVEKKSEEISKSEEATEEEVEEGEEEEVVYLCPVC